MAGFLSEYKKYLEETKGVSSNTLESYLRDVSQYISYLQLENDYDITHTNAASVEAYTEYLKTENKSNATITRMVASMRSYYQFLMMIGVMDNNPAKNVKIERVKKKIPEVLTDKEIRMLLEAPNANEIKGARDKAMLELLYATGIRVSELIGLNVQDIHCAKNVRGEIICRNGKGARIIPMHREAADALLHYITAVRPLLVSAESGGALFINLNGSRLTRQGFWKIVKNYAEATKINKEITPHTLRHSFAIHLYQNGASLHDLQVMLGHSDISSTQLYAAMSRQNSYGDVYDRCHPLAAAARSK